jgi:excisionase family DNA binding protein
MEAEYLTPQEVADKLRINERTVRRLLREGELPGGIRVGKKTWRISAIALKAYIESGGGAIAKGKKSGKSGH